MRDEPPRHETALAEAMRHFPELKRLRLRSYTGRDSALPEDVLLAPCLPTLEALVIEEYELDGRGQLSWRWQHLHTSARHICVLQARNLVLRAAGLRDFLYCIGRLSSLQCLCLEQWTVDWPFYFDVARPLKNLVALTELRLACWHVCGKGHEGMHMVPSALSRLAQLTLLKTLDVRGNDFADRGFELVSRALCILTGLRALNLRENYPAADRFGLSRSGMFAQGVRWFAPSLISLRQLQELDISNNIVGDDGVCALGQCWRSLVHLTRLNMSFVYLGFELGFGVGNMHLADLRAIRWLNLAGNEFDRYTKAVTRELSSLTELSHLDLGQNGVLDSDLGELMVHLQGMIALKQLRMQRNWLNRQAAKAHLEPLGVELTL
jgi:hypothetical protein